MNFKKNKKEMYKESDARHRKYYDTLVTRIHLVITYVVIIFLLTAIVTATALTDNNLIVTVSLFILDCIVIFIFTVELSFVIRLKDDCFLQDEDDLKHDLLDSYVRTHQIIADERIRQYDIVNVKFDDDTVICRFVIQLSDNNDLKKTVTVKPLGVLFFTKQKYYITEEVQGDKLSSDNDDNDNLDKD